MIVLSVFLALGMGCQQSAPLATVTGTVSLDGKPIKKGTVRFESTGRPATGRIENGAIVEVTTFKGTDGALIGTHKVAFWAFEDVAPGDANYMSGKSILPEQYNNPDTSGAVVEIKSGVNTVDFKLVTK